MSASPNHEARTLDHENVTPRIGAGGGLSFVTTALRVAFVVVLVCVAFFVGGFLRFATTVSHISPSDDINADAIVVLTGGADRIEGALDLLANGHAKRLLISGVHPKTTRGTLAKQSSTQADLFTCCVDLDKKAEDTIGNAEQTSAWVHEYGFRSLIVVTSAYHIPRSMAELQNALPSVELKPYPVVRRDLMMHEWYAHWGTTRLLLREYLKYVAARLRLSMELEGDGSRQFVSCIDCRAAS